LALIHRAQALTDISMQEETDRLLPTCIEAIVAALSRCCFIYRYFPRAVAEAAIKAGAHIINDISGGQLDEICLPPLARLQVPYILMHMKGNPKTMQQLADYDDVFNEVLDYFVTHNIIS
jgi:dihydropteroate synthase